MYKPLVSSVPKATAQTENNTAAVQVAVGVLHYQDQYLLGYRNKSQHQGNLYEFVGGKVDTNESAIEALRREVNEETGIDISQNIAVLLGEIKHDYGDKEVCLQVYQITLNSEQYEQNRHRDYGLEGQALIWVSKPELIAGHYPLPAANQTILTWLKNQH